MGEPLHTKKRSSEADRKAMRAWAQQCIAVTAGGLIVAFLVGAAVFDMVHNPGSWPTVRDVWSAVAMFVGVLISFFLPLNPDDP